jgi:DNA polymerase-3 subunit alpha
MLVPIDCVTHYSLLMGLNRPDSLAKTAAEYGYTSLGICDYNSVSSAVQHVTECKKYNIKPILGARVSDNHIFIAKNRQGWCNLLKLVSNLPKGVEISSDGLILIGTDNRYMVDDFFHSEEVGLMNSHYLHKEDSNDHKVLLCAKHGQTLNSLNKVSGYDERFINNENFFFKNQEEFSSCLTSTQKYNTEKINDMVESFSIFRKPMLPNIFSSSPEEELKNICRRRWTELGINNYEESLKQKYIDRIRREFEVIHEAGLESYFLIVGDYINWAKRQGILVGPGRGSSGGCLIPYRTWLIL